MKKLLHIILGIILSLAIPFLGLLLTSYTDDVLAVLFSIILIPIIGISLFMQAKFKQIGFGLLLGLIPLAFLVGAFVVASSLH